MEDIVNHFFAKVRSDEIFDWDAPTKKVKNNVLYRVVFGLGCFRELEDKTRGIE